MIPGVTLLATRVGAVSGWRRLVLGFLAGAALAGAQAPLSWPILLFVGLPVLFRLLDGCRGPIGGALLGWAAGLGYFAADLFWIVEPFMVDAARFGWMAPFALAGMAGGLALFWAAAFGLARAVWPPGPSRVLVLAALWTFADYARAHVLTGFPWGLPAYAWIETPVAQTAALFGPHVLGFLTLVAGLSLGLATWRGAAMAAALVAAGWTLGMVRLAAPAPERAEPVIVRLVQPNARQEEKWLPGKDAEFFQRLIDLTRAPADPMPDVTLWPETAVSFVLDDDPAAQALAAAATGPAGRLITGIRRVELWPQGQVWFNSLAVLAPDGAEQGIYDKHHLVPFGEYIPKAGLVARLGIPGLETLTGGGFSPGPGPRLVAPPGLPPFLPLICYEAIFPDGARAPGGRPEWIVQLTNDAWFGEVSGPYQHLAQARARAIEQGVPLARAANTGISAMIDARGEIVESLGLGRAGYIDVALPGALPPTLYFMLGDWPGLAAIAFIFVLTVTNFYGGISLTRQR